MWVKRDLKPTLQQDFDEAILVEKDMLSLNNSPNINTDQPSTSHKKDDPINKIILQRKNKVFFILKIFKRLCRKYIMK